MKDRRNPARRRAILQNYKRLEEDNCLTEQEIARELNITIDIVKRLEKESMERGWYNVSK